MRQIYDIREDLKLKSNSHVWRYLTIEKFISILLTRKLYFTDVKSLTDQYEITVPVRNRVKLWTNLIGDNTHENAEVMAKINQETETARNKTYLNCWSMQSTESYALWKIYLQNAKCGIAIRTTLSRLRKSLISIDDHPDEKVNIDLVDYTDYIPDDDLTVKKIILSKRTYYKYENELRMYIVGNEKDNISPDAGYSCAKCRHVNVDIDILIESLLFSPFLSKSYSDSLEEALKILHPNLRNKFKHSSIRDI